MRAQGSVPQALVKRRHVALDRHDVVRAPGEDGLRGVGLRMQRVDRDDRPGQVGERLQQLPDGGDLVRFRRHGGLPEHGADAVCQRRDQVRGLPVLVPGAADRLAVDRDYQPALLTCTALVCSQAPST